MKTVYLVRHGESESNAGPVNKGKAAELTPRGYEQAAFVAQRVAKLPIEIIVSSPYPRTKETARIISEKIGKPVEYSELFVERRWPSEQVGISPDSARFKEIEASLFENFPSPGYRFSNEESFEELNVRAGKALQYLLERSEERILVVGHGTFTHMLVGKALWGDAFNGQNALFFWRSFVFSNVGISIMRQARYVPWEILVWNDHAHLG